MLSVCRKIASFIFIVAVCLICYGCLARSEKVVRGVLYEDQIWQDVVFIEGNVILSPGTHLTILPGTKVLFLEAEDHGSFNEHPYFKGSELIVRGRITAIGSPEEPIVFAAADSAGGPGSWGAVNIEESPEAIFEYCIFRQADSAVHSRDSHVYIEQSVFESNLVGVRFHDTEMLIEKNLFLKNDAAVRFHFGSPVICENVFTENNVNLFVTSHPRDYHIENNSFGRPLEYHVVFGEEVPEDVKMPRNHWQPTPAGELEELFFDGTRSDYLGRVIYSPRRTTPSQQAGPSWTR